MINNVTLIQGREGKVTDILSGYQEAKNKEVGAKSEQKSHEVNHEQGIGSKTTNYIR